MRTLTFMLLPLALFAESPAPDVRSLSWISGCWEASTGSAKFEEQWSKPAGGTMLGFGRMIKGDRTVFSEFMQIAASAGKLVYTARIGAGGRAGTPFTLTRMSDTEAVFENPEHDFPQRIVYRRNPDGSLHARIDGMDKGKRRAEDFPLQRAKCE